MKKNATLTEKALAKWVKAQAGRRAEKYVGGSLGPDRACGR